MPYRSQLNEGGLHFYQSAHQNVFVNLDFISKNTVFEPKTSKKFKNDTNSTQNEESCLPEMICQEDLDHDGVIGINDLMDMLSAFGSFCED